MKKRRVKNRKKRDDRKELIAEFLPAFLDLLKSAGRKGKDARIMAVFMTSLTIDALFFFRNGRAKVRPLNEMKKILEESKHYMWVLIESIDTA